jgi:hypothetical protein
MQLREELTKFHYFMPECIEVSLRGVLPYKALYSSFNNWRGFKVRIQNHVVEKAVEEGDIFRDPIPIHYPDANGTLIGW